jgi:hypothetical protein
MKANWMLRGALDRQQKEARGLGVGGGERTYVSSHNVGGGFGALPTFGPNGCADWIGNPAYPDGQGVSYAKRD